MSAPIQRASRKTPTRPKKGEPGYQKPVFTKCPEEGTPIPEDFSPDLYDVKELDRMLCAYDIVGRTKLKREDKIDVIYAIIKSGQYRNPGVKSSAGQQVVNDKFGYIAGARSPGGGRNTGRQAAEQAVRNYLGMFYKNTNRKLPYSSMNEAELKATLRELQDRKITTVREFEDYKENVGIPQIKGEISENAREGLEAFQADYKTATQSGLIRKNQKMKKDELIDVLEAAGQKARSVRGKRGAGSAMRPRRSPMRRASPPRRGTMHNGAAAASHPSPTRSHSPVRRSTHRPFPDRSQSRSPSPGRRIMPRK